MHMGSETVTKAVAKKLKYYVDVKRREDGFDLSGPYLPKPEPVPLRPGPTLAYDGLHDRSLKHYFKSSGVKRQVGKMTVPVEKSSRELEIRAFLDTEMAKRSYKLTSGTKSPYKSSMERSTPKHRPQALISVDEYLRTKRGSQQRKVKPNVIGKPRKVVRRSPPQYVCKNERERLVNMAARLIVATETAALPGNQSSQTKSLTYENSLPEVNTGSRCSYTEDSSDTEISLDTPDAYPRPPSRAGGPRPKWTPPSLNGVEFEQNKQKPHHSRLSKNSIASSDTSEDIRDQVKNAKGVSKKDRKGSRRPNTASPTLRKKTLELSLPHSQYRSHSARVGQRSNRQNGEWKKDGKKNKHQISNFSFLEHSDEEQNEKGNNFRRDDEEEVPDSKLFYKRPQQNKNALRNRVLTYKVYVITGNRHGASTDADVKLTLFGDSGSSGERCLLKSMNHSHKFRKGQLDIFPIDSICLGYLQNIRIGHTQTSRGKGWFLEKVFVSEGAKENSVFEFPCKRWFSSEKDDGQIIRDICVSQILTDSELTDKLDDYASPAEQTSDDESDVSYSSFESTEEAKETEEKRRSSEEEEISESEAREKSHDRGKNKKDSENEDGRKKTVSFEKEEKNKSDSEEEKKKSENENHSSESEGSEKGQEHNGSESNSEDEDNTEVKKTEEDVPRKSAEEDDFWSNGSDKGEAIHYDLGVDDNNEISKDVENPSSRSSTPSSTSSPESNPKNSDNERVENEEEDTKKDGEHSGSGQGSGDEGKKEKTGDGNEDKMAEETPRNESVEDHDDVKSDQDSNKEYMAGFLAGVRAREQDSQQQQDEGHGDDTALDDSMEDGDFILSKGPSLHSAVASGNVERVKELMQHNPSLKEQTDEKGWTPLHVGCANGQLECVKVIALCGGNLEQETPTGYTSMHLAAMNGHVNCMMVLFGLGAEISCRTIDEYTPLHLAAMSGHVECVKWLLANRVKHNVTDVNGRTPVEIAEEYCHEEVAKLLKSFNKEMTQSDSTLAHLMTYEGHRKKSTDSVMSDTAGTLNKIADSGVGGLGSGEESWVSDNEDEDEEDEENTSKSASGRPTSARRVSSARSDDSVMSMNRTDSMTSIKEKQDLYKKQRQQMKKRNSSFLDSIRMDVEVDKQD